VALRTVNYGCAFAIQIRDLVGCYDGFSKAYFFSVGPTRDTAKNSIMIPFIEGFSPYCPWGGFSMSIQYHPSSTRTGSNVKNSSDSRHLSTPINEHHLQVVQSNGPPLIQISQSTAIISCLQQKILPFLHSPADPAPVSQKTTPRAKVSFS